jgi:cyanophycinase
MGIIALAGGNEFRDNCEAMDRRLLEVLSAKAGAVAVAVLPTAAIEGSPRMAGENGVRHFNRLGAKAYNVMAVTHEDADNPAFVKDIERADVVYLAGGDPWYLLEVLRNSAILDAAKRVYERGGLLAGSSAGAMVLAEQMRTQDFGGWLDGLGIAAGVSVLPHHEHADSHQVESLLGRLKSGITLLGIEEATACFRADKSEAWEVAGVGGVMVYRASGAVRYSAGEQFKLGMKM